MRWYSDPCQGGDGSMAAAALAMVVYRIASHKRMEAWKVH